MTVLADLAAELLPAARPIGAQDAPARPIAWVRVMRARVPAFDALEAGDLAIVPASALATLAPATAEATALVDAMARVPVSGALLVEAEAPANDGADRFEAALAAAGLPGLRVPRTDLAALERSVIGFIVARGAEMERQAALLEGELERRALEGSGVAALVATVAGFLGRALALESDRGEPIAVHAPAEAAATAAAAARYRPGSRRPADAVVALRVPLPAPAGDGGSLVILGAEAPSELARAVLPRVAGIVALELARDAAVQRAAERARRAEPMPSAGPPWTMVLARQREPGADDDTPAARESREARRRELRLLAPAGRLGMRGDADSLEIRAVVAGAPAEAAALVERMAGLLGRTVAVSRPFGATADRPAAEAEARTTLEAAGALKVPPRVARADRLPVYRLLGALHKLPDAHDLARAVLEPLVDARPDVRRERTATLRAVLQHGGVGEAAAALRVHRNTVAYRLRRIEAATGWQLGDPELRLALAVALELVQDEQD